jgi:hypothetical protein
MALVWAMWRLRRQKPMWSVFRMGFRGFKAKFGGESGI